MRIFQLEPFLRKTESHFFEVALAMSSHFQSQKSVPFRLVGNRSLEKPVTRLFPNVVAGISQTCFEDPDNKGATFADDLFQLHTDFKFQPHDLLIVTTSYENQILGTARYQKLISNSPMIALHFHQLFPPSIESDDVAKPSFRRFWRTRLRRAFSQSTSHRVSYWTTECKKLNDDFRQVAQREIGMLPVPFLSYRETTPLFQSSTAGGFTVAYLGDGRQEKGLLIWLKAIHALCQSGKPYEFIVQINNPRGFNDSQRLEVEALKNDLKDYRNVRLLNGPLPTSDFHRVLNTIDLLAIPYNPLNYCRRVSGLAMHAAAYEKPLLVSSDTWAAQEVKKGRLAGTIFKFDRRREEMTIRNIIECLELAFAKRQILKRLAAKAASYFRSRNTPAGYVNRIVDFYSGGNRLI